MAKLSTEELLDQFKELTLIELSEFVKAFEETFDVTAAAPVAVAGAARAAGGAGGEAAAEEEKAARATPCKKPRGASKRTPSGRYPPVRLQPRLLPPQPQRHPPWRLRRPCPWTSTQRPSNSALRAWKLP